MSERTTSRMFYFLKWDLSEIAGDGLERFQKTDLSLKGLHETKDNPNYRVSHTTFGLNLLGSHPVLHLAGKWTGESVAAV